MLGGAAASTASAARTGEANVLSPVLGAVTAGGADEFASTVKSTAKRVSEIGSDKTQREVEKQLAIMLRESGVDEDTVATLIKDLKAGEAIYENKNEVIRHISDVLATTAQAKEALAPIKQQAIESQGGKVLDIAQKNLGTKEAAQTAAKQAPVKFVDRLKSIVGGNADDLDARAQGLQNEIVTTYQKIAGITKEEAESRLAGSFDDVIQQISDKTGKDYTKLKTVKDVVTARTNEFKDRYSALSTSELSPEAKYAYKQAKVSGDTNLGRAEDYYLTKVPKYVEGSEELRKSLNIDKIVDLNQATVRKSGGTTTVADTAEELVNMIRNGDIVAADVVSNQYLRTINNLTKNQGDLVKAGIGIDEAGNYIIKPGMTRDVADNLLSNLSEARNATSTTLRSIAKDETKQADKVALEQTEKVLNAAIKVLTPKVKNPDNIGSMKDLFEMRKYLSDLKQADLDSDKSAKFTYTESRNAIKAIDNIIESSGDENAKSLLKDYSKRIKEDNVVETLRELRTKQDVGARTEELLKSPALEEAVKQETPYLYKLFHSQAVRDKAIKDFKDNLAALKGTREDKISKNIQENTLLREEASTAAMGVNPAIKEAGEVLQPLDTLAKQADTTQSQADLIRKLEPNDVSGTVNLSKTFGTDVPSEAASRNVEALKTFDGGVDALKQYDIEQQANNAIEVIYDNISKGIDDATRNEKILDVDSIVKNIPIESANAIKQTYGEAVFEGFKEGLTELNKKQRDLKRVTSVKPNIDQKDPTKLLFELLQGGKVGSRLFGISSMFADAKLQPEVQKRIAKALFSGNTDEAVKLITAVEKRMKDFKDDTLLKNVSGIREAILGLNMGGNIGIRENN